MKILKLFALRYILVKHDYELFVRIPVYNNIFIYLITIEYRFYSNKLYCFSNNPDPEKLSAYECGFEAFDNARIEFDVRFYLVAILFIIFDLEIAFLFPWAISLGNIGLLGFYSMMAFLFILTIGFIYEWKKGALEWE